MPKRKEILFICGSHNQTTQMHQIASELPEYDQWFSPFYGSDILEFWRQHGFCDWTIMGGEWREACLRYLRKERLPIDIRGERGNYDLVVTCQDIVYPTNILDKKVVLVQEGMTDPITWSSHFIKAVKVLPRWFASTSLTGLSDAYTRFCVASHGYRDQFVERGARADKIVVTGIPNFDRMEQYRTNDFPHRDYVLVVTSDGRETFKMDDRRALIERAVQIANGRRIIFKLHPNERHERARREIAAWAPGSLVFVDGKAEDMIANCAVLMTEYSTCTYVGLALEKEVHSYFDLEELRRLMPLQHGMAAKNIANVCRELLDAPPRRVEPTPHRRETAHAEISPSA
jgi:hypothetical protein